MATLVTRALFIAAAWWILVEGDVSALAFGVPVVALAVITRSAQADRTDLRVRPWGLVRLLTVFLTGVVRGGFDVARRALAPRLPVSPGWLMYDIRLSGEAPLRLLMMAISVMPGTISVNIEQAKLRIHVLVTRGDQLRKQVQALEASIAHAFGEPRQEEG